METEQLLSCKPITDSTNPILHNVEQSYNDAFPECERRDFSLVRKLIDEHPLFSLHALYRGDCYVGFITGWHFTDCTYLEHFAIDASARNGGIGGKALSHFIAHCPPPVVLEVELPTDEMSRRRIGFYQRLGFTLDTHTYFQPPYRPGEEALEMRLMTHGEIDLNQAFDSVVECIHREVYGVKL